MSTSYNDDANFRDFIRSLLVPDAILEEAIEWIKKNLDPEDVFDKSDLEIWAETNDYVIPED
jgi:hypothetical protein